MPTRKLFPLGSSTSRGTPRCRGGVVAAPDKLGLGLPDPFPRPGRECGGTHRPLPTYIAERSFPRSRQFDTAGRLPVPPVQGLDGFDACQRRFPSVDRAYLG